jgi:ADP-ribose pyrophosphatase YjhB (NUDIX family)/spermidine synthase
MTIRARKHAMVRLTVDLVILTVRDATLQVLLVKRGNEPFAGEFALPGGFMRDGEPLGSAARRELAEETNMDTERLHLEQLSTYADPDRDPRGRIVTVAYLAIAPNLPTPVAGTDAADASWQPVEPLLAGGGPRAFDHHQILVEGLERAREKLEYTTLATAFCSDAFTIADLRRSSLGSRPGSGEFQPEGHQHRRLRRADRPEAGGRGRPARRALPGRPRDRAAPAHVARPRLTGRNSRAGTGRPAPAWEDGPVSYSLVADEQHHGGFILLIDGVSQSYVDVGDQAALRFSYMRRLATVIDALAPAGAPIRVLHLGGGAMSLPRYIALTRPGSRQVVVDRDGEMIGYVQRELPLPAGADITVVIADAREAAESFDDDSFDLLITDVYVGAQMPRSVATVEFARHAARLVGPDGVFATNLADLPPLAFSRVEAATLRTVFDEVFAIGEPGMFRGRRYGNVVLAAASKPSNLPAAKLARLARADAKPARLLRGDDLNGFIAGALPITDADAADWMSEGDTHLKGR